MKKNLFFKIMKELTINQTLNTLELLLRRVDDYINKINNLHSVIRQSILIQLNRPKFYLFKCKRIT